MVLLPSPAAEHIYCEGNSTNNRVAFALTVSKCRLGSFKRQLNFSVLHYHRARMDDFTELFLKEQYLGCTFFFLALASWMSQLKSIAHGKCFCNLFDHIKIGNRFVCCDNVCWARGSQTVSHSGLLDVYEATDKMSVGLYKQRTLPYPVKESVRTGLGKHCIYGIFLPPH